MRGERKGKRWAGATFTTASGEWCRGVQDAARQDKEREAQDWWRGEVEKKVSRRRITRSAFMRQGRAVAGEASKRHPLGTSLRLNRPLSSSSCAPSTQSVGQLPAARLQREE